MSSKKSTFNKKHLLWIMIACGVGLLVAGGAVFGAVGYGRLYTGRIFPGVRILDVRLDGLTAEEARATLYKQVDEALRDGLRFQFHPSDGSSPIDIALAATTVGTADPDASRDLVRYELEPAVIAALHYGRGNNLILNTLARWRARVRPIQLDAGVTLDEEGVSTGLEQAVQASIPAVQNASLNIQWKQAEQRADVRVVPEKTGRAINTDVALRQLHRQAERLQFVPIEITDHELRPTLTAKDVEPLKQSVPFMLALAPFRLVFEEHDLLVSTSTLAQWLDVEVQNGKPVLTITPDHFKTRIRAFAPGIEKQAKQGSLIFDQGVITRFEAGAEGLTIDDATTLQNILNAWAKGESPREFPLVVVRTPPALAGQDPERLGIKEILGEGHSNFSGSPSNRRRNIALGVKKVNGTLIPPGEEFSLLTTLGPVTAENGWLPELVIKGNKTVPELGGGLCQIGTTTFRAALSSGLPITQRQNHSYRVRYYEPAGTDATIYEPRPDFRFTNNTGHHVLIHAFIEGDNITYEFWGTGDKRTTLFKGQKDVTDVDDLKPRIFNQTAPPPTKLIETLDLKPGEKKCTEVAHAGADAEFTYVINYPDGSVVEEVFRSHYRPWQAVCLIGVETLSNPEQSIDASVPGSPDSAPSVSLGAGSADVVPATVAE